MPENRRQFPRLPIKVQVRIEHPDFGERTVWTRNISDGGLFVVTEPKEVPNIGSVVTGQVVGVEEETPIVRMRIIRIGIDGVALEFIS